MGGGLGGSRVVNSNTKLQVARNVRDLIKEFPLSPGGYFGKPGRNKKVRRIAHKDPKAAADKFMRLLTNGFRPYDTKPGHYKQYRLGHDGYVRIRYRSNSDGSIAIDIVVSKKGLGSIASQKIHFIQEASK